MIAGQAELRLTASKDDKSSVIRSTTPEKARKLILNTYRTLLTRGQKGCYIYCEDVELQKYMENFILKMRN